LQIYFYDANDNPDTTNSYTSPRQTAGTTFSHTMAIPTTAVYWFVYAAPYGFLGTGPTNNCQSHLQLYCAGTPTTIVQPCCPTDPALDVRLRRIEQLEQVIIQLLGHGGGKHVDGTRHAGLTNSGTINLIDSIDAVRVEVKTSLSGWPNNPGSPNYYFSLGFITSIAAGSPLKGWRLVYGSQTYPIVTYADQIGFTLPPGVSIDLVELLPAA